MPRTSPRAALGLERLESRDTPSILAIGSQAGDVPEVRVFDETGQQITSFMAYDPSFRGGVRSAVGDVTGDGIPDIVTVPGAGGGAQVNVYDGTDGHLARSFFAYDPSFTGGASVAVGTIAGREVIVTGAGVGGGPQVNVYDAVSGDLDQSFFAFGTDFAGGVSVAVGDVYGDGRGEVVAAAGPGGGPQVSVFDGPTAALRESYFALDPGFRGGVSVTVGDVLGLGRDQVVTGAGFGGGPRVDVHDPLTGRTMDSFFAYDPSFTGGVGVGVIDGPGHDLLVTAPGPGGGPDVRVFDVTAPGGGVVVNNFFAFAPTFTYGLTLGSGFGVWRPYLSALGPASAGCPVAVPADTDSSGSASDFSSTPDIVIVDPFPVASYDPGPADPGSIIPDTSSVDTGDTGDYGNNSGDYGWGVYVDDGSTGDTSGDTGSDSGDWGAPIDP